MFRFVSYLLLLGLTVGLMGCPFANDPLPLAPVTPTKTSKTAYKSRVAIHSFSPDTARSEAELTIRGMGFNPALAENQVYLNGKQASVLRGTDTTLVVRVPSKAGTGAVEVQVGTQRAKAEKTMVYRWTAIVEKIIIEGKLYGHNTSVDKFGNFYILGGFYYTFITKYSQFGKKLEEIGYEAYGSRADHTIDLVSPVADQNDPNDNLKLYIFASYYSPSGMASYLGELNVDFKKPKVEREEWPGTPNRLITLANFKLIDEISWYKSSNLMSPTGINELKTFNNEILLSGYGTFIKYIDNKLINPPGPSQRFIATYAGNKVFVLFPDANNIKTAIYQVEENGEATLWAGSELSKRIDGYKDKAAFGNIITMKGDEAGRIFVLDNTILRMITPDGFVQTLIELPCNQLHVGVDGKLYAYKDSDNTIYRLTIQ